ncbi:hypothetical protein C6990_03660 [Nitrosopumilus sp. b3]|uniref:hypothetical protein n=1 Tax=Nitrosopumilus sp. b3 TaxID=2109909 RepID=UPI0015F5AFDF|nr:hypothetical protein [Nitrosopumilus sp. b3]KAF6247558.1 hypothetical protein C6990_03660 [Nitrosopumilus sp. b3]
MNKSLGDYNVAKSSSINVRNIVWTTKNLQEPEKFKSKKSSLSKKSLPTNIIYGEKPQQNLKVEKVFKINQENVEKLKCENSLNKKFQKSSANNCKIKQGFKRPGR